MPTFLRLSVQNPSTVKAFLRVAPRSSKTESSPVISWIPTRRENSACNPPEVLVARSQTHPLPAQPTSS
jgi:hypothetical protein